MKRKIPIGKSQPAKDLPPQEEVGPTRQGLVMARDMTTDLLRLHRKNLDVLNAAIEKPGVLLDEDNLPHKLILDQISALQKDIIAASHTLLKLDATLSPQKEKAPSRGESKAIAEPDKPVDVNAIILSLPNNQTKGD